MSFPIQLPTGYRANLSEICQNNKVDLKVGLGTRNYLNFDSKNKLKEICGSFFLGSSDDPEIVQGEKIVVISESLRHGWILWASANDLRKQMVSFTESLPERLDPVNEKQPNEAREFDCIFINDEARTLITFSTGSLGAVGACNKLFNAVFNKLVSEPNTEYYNPIVKLSCSAPYQSQFGLIYNPVFEVVGWMNNSGDLEGEIKVVQNQQEDTSISRQTIKRTPRLSSN